MISAIHINSTAPFAIKKNGAAYYQEDFELLCTVLSALMWRKTNGSIKLYTDKTGYDYYGSLGLLDLWDAGIDTSVVENIPESINQEIFWAAAKIFALRNETTPVAVLDTDLIVWESLGHELADKQFAVLHREELYPSVYISGFHLKTRSDYQFDPEWDWTARPCNMSFSYFSDHAFKEYYTDCAIDFMMGNGEYPMPMEMISQMVFAEQRIAAMCAVKKNIPIHHFLHDPFQTDNKRFTHLWGGKDQARNDVSRRKALCTATLRKIDEYFPDYHNKLMDAELFRNSRKY
jgi:hypothetical protein